jgi:hypothetical protein
MMAGSKWRHLNKGGRGLHTKASYQGRASPLPALQHFLPQFLTSQIFITESCYWLTGPIKTAKNAHNTRFLQLARLGSASLVLPVGDEMWG